MNSLYGIHGKRIEDHNEDFNKFFNFVKKFCIKTIRNISKDVINKKNNEKKLEVKRKNMR